MRIKKVTIKNFRSILNSGQVNLNNNITILLGQNEAGKTSVLKALEKFDTNNKFEYVDLPLDSTIKKKFDNTEIDGRNIPIITVIFELEKEDRIKLKKMHPNLAKIETIQCTKFFDNSYEVIVPDVDLSDRNQELQDKIKKNIEEIHDCAETFKNDLDTIFVNEGVKRFQRNFEGVLDEIIAFDNTKNIDNLNNHQLERIINHPSITSHITAFNTKVDAYKEEIRELLSDEKEDPINQILEILPNFIYFSTIEELEDSAPLSDLIHNKEKYKTLKNLLKLANIDLKEIQRLDDREMISKLRNSSIKISGDVNKSWKQKKVNIDINIRGKNLIVSTYDKKQKEFHNPNIRSEGFKWFLSFYINFTAGSEGEFQNTILLLDDPGVYLHASGQKDLLRTLENIAKSNQIILSTHSPFLVDRDKTDRIRIVSNEAKGTKITEKFYKSKFDAFAPIRASIGMSISDSLFIGEKTVIVEGHSDKLILNSMSRLLERQKDNHLNSSQISILPVNSADKTSYYSAIFLNGKIDFIVLLDYDDKGRKTAKKLIKEFDDDIIVISFNQLDGIKQGDLDIEDLIDFEFYFEALNNAYKKIFTEKLGKNRILSNDLDSESFRSIKKYFKINKAKIGDLDKIKVANELNEMMIKDQYPNDDTKRNFSSLFKMINNKLETS